MSPNPSGGNAPSLLTTSSGLPDAATSDGASSLPSLAFAGIGPRPVLLGAEQSADQRKTPKQVRFELPEHFDLDDSSIQAATIEDSAVVESEDLSEEERLVRAARGLSLISLAASLLVASFALTLGIAEGALSLLGFGGEMFLDAVSSSFVLWRFKRPKASGPDGDNVDAAAEAEKMVLRVAKRERKSSFGIGATFVILALFLAYSAVWKFLEWDAWDPEHVREEQAAVHIGSVLVWSSSLFFGGLAVMKLRLAHKLQSQVLQKDGMCSVLGALLGAIVGITDLVALANQDDPDSLALVDPAAGLLVALILMIEGCRTLWHNRTGGEHADAHQRMP